MKIFIQLTALFVVLFFSSCVAAKEYNLSLSVTGEINHTSVSQIINNLNNEPNIKILRINSGGGNEKAALSLSKVIAEKNISIIVDGACISACAHLMLPAAKNIYVTEGSVIGFHSNIFGWLHAFYSFDKREFNNIIDDARVMASFLEVNDIDIDTLFCIDRLLISEKPFRRNVHGKISRTNKYNFLIANDDLLKSYGIKVHYIRNISGDTKEKLKASGVSLESTLVNWRQEMCREAILFSDWVSVKYELENKRN